SAGFGPFGPSNLLDVDNPSKAINLQGPASPDGGQYALVGTGGIAGDATGDPATLAMIKNGVDIVLHGYAGQTISNIRFQFGTVLTDPHAPPPTSFETSITTDASEGGTVGSVTLNDTATLTSSDMSLSISGSITFALTAPDSTVVYTETDPVSAGAG